MMQTNKKNLNCSISKSSDNFMCTTYASPHLEAAGIPKTLEWQHRIGKHTYSSRNVLKENNSVDSQPSIVTYLWSLEAYIYIYIFANKHEQCAACISISLSANPGIEQFFCKA